jgi:outer membrane protein OmpA-like peptidoglycan-associated protein/opacity protein-like surface antigen
MKLAALCSITMAIAFVMVPVLSADDGPDPGTKTKKVESGDPISTLAVPVKAEPEKAPAHSSSGQSQAGAQAQPVGGIHRWDESKHYSPKVEWFLGYSFWRAMPTSVSNRMGYLHGGSTSVAYNLNRYIGLVGDFGAYDNSRLTLFGPNGSRTVDSDGMAYTYMLGPRFSYRRFERFTPFAQALFGGASASSVTISGCTGTPSCTPLGSDNTFATMLGTGFDIQVSRHVALRLFQGDFLLTHFNNPSSTGGPERGWQKNARFSAGIVFRSGGNSAPPPIALMGASCSADKAMIYAGSGDFVVIRADASNPDHNSLNYFWSASEGAVTGTGPEVRWNSSDRRPGTYTFKVRVDDGRKGTADCSVNIRVEPRPNRPPTISCSADRRAVTVSEPVEITAMASDLDNDPLSFSWYANGAQIEGSGSSVKLQTASLSTGSYTIVGHVDDGRSGTAECTVNVSVLAAPVPAEVTELETRLSLHSVYFPTGRPTIVNPAGGLVGSQQTVLLILVSDFKRYLTFKPQAHLILEGHADRRGPLEYNKDLTERRVELTKSFLVERGVPGANIETRALGQQENLDGNQVKQLVEQNPDLSSEERQRIEGNLQAIVWANNRRVDISLNTTGQQSLRQYPFNAKDSLTLLSARDGDAERPVKMPANKNTLGRKREFRPK